MDKLITCPFCGADVAQIGTVAEILDTEPNDPNYEWCLDHYAVVCDAQIGGCGSMTGCANETPEAAAEAWNRRAK